MRLLVEGEIHRAVSSLFLTAGGWRFYCSEVMVALAVGFIEWSRGTFRAAITFLGIHFATLITMTVGVVLWDELKPSVLSDLLWNVQDVGPSAGYYGCLGLALASASPSKRSLLLWSVLLWLALRTCWSVGCVPEDGSVISADVAHVIAFPLGALKSLFRNRGRQTVDDSQKLWRNRLLNRTSHTKRGEWHKECFFENAKAYSVPG